MKTVPLRTIIIDDETEACDYLKAIFSAHLAHDINIVGIANDTAEAERLIGELRPDVVFLDIEMPGENAFQFLRRIYPYDFEVVFVTAFDEYAIKAFKLNAVDYLLKPADVHELVNSVQKLQQKISYKHYFDNKDDRIDVLTRIANKEKPQKIVLRSLNSLEIVAFADLLYIEGDGSYSRVHFLKNGKPAEIMISNILSDYEELLPADRFYRIHKSYLINCAHIGAITKENNYELIMNNKCKLPISRRRFADFINFLKEHQFRVD